MAPAGTTTLGYLVVRVSLYSAAAAAAYIAAVAPDFAGAVAVACSVFAPVLLWLRLPLFLD